MKTIIFLILTLNLVASASFADDKKEVSLDSVREKPTWNTFSVAMQQQADRDSVNGLSYVISGGVAIIGGLVGYNTSQDVFAKAVYSLSQTVGIAAVGYGAYTLSLGDEHRVFYQTIHDIKGLTPTQKDDLVKGYFNLEKSRERSTRTIKAITHGLVALLNGYNGATSSNNDLKTAFFFIAGVNALASISFAF